MSDLLRFHDTKLKGQQAVKVWWRGESATLLAYQGDDAVILVDGYECSDTVPREQIQVLPEPREAEPMMAACQWCELAHEIEDTRILLDLSRVCTECLDGKYGPERDGRWPQ